MWVCGCMFLSVFAPVTYYPCVGSYYKGLPCVGVCIRAFQAFSVFFILEMEILTHRRPVNQDRKLFFSVSVQLFWKNMGVLLS